MESLQCIFSGRLSYVKPLLQPWLDYGLSIVVHMKTGRPKIWFSNVAVHKMAGQLPGYRTVLGQLKLCELIFPKLTHKSWGKLRGNQYGYLCWKYDDNWNKISLTVNAMFSLNANSFEKSYTIHSKLVFDLFYWLFCKSYARVPPTYSLKRSLASL